MVGLPDPPAVWLGYLLPELIVPWIIVIAHLISRRRQGGALGNSTQPRTPVIPEAEALAEAIRDLTRTPRCKIPAQRHRAFCATAWPG